MTADPLPGARGFCAAIVAERWPSASVASLVPLQGDASTRSYARLTLAGPDAGMPATLVVMMLKDAAVAMSSEELGVYGKEGPKELAFVNVGRFLARHTDAVPAILAVSDDSRLLLLEDVGDTPLWDAAAANPSETFGRALDLIADLQARAIDDGSGCYAFRQSFDERLFVWEFEHFLEYGVAGAADSLMEASRRELMAVAARLATLPRVFSHRDYHAWNIHVQNGRLRLIDFQDALLAPALYDVASLLTDRITPERITPGIEESLLVRFHARQKAGHLESLAATRSAYRLIALQRVLKVVGRFHYLAEVKGKPHYLGLLPAVCKTARRFLATSDGVSATAELFEIAGRDPSIPGRGDPIRRPPEASRPEASRPEASRPKRMAIAAASQVAAAPGPAVAEDGPLVVAKAADAAPLADSPSPPTRRRVKKV